MQSILFHPFSDSYSSLTPDFLKKISSSVIKAISIESELFQQFCNEPFISDLFHDFYDRPLTLETDLFYELCNEKLQLWNLIRFVSSMMRPLTLETDLFHDFYDESFKETTPRRFGYKTIFGMDFCFR